MYGYPGYGFQGGYGCGCGNGENNGWIWNNVFLREAFPISKLLQIQVIGQFHISIIVLNK